MRLRRLVKASVVTFLAASVVACANGGGAGNPAPRPPASIPADPAEAIASAKAQFGRESVRFAFDGGSAKLSYTGMVDAATKNWEVRGDTFVVRRIGSEIYVQGGAETATSVLLLPSSAVDHLAAGGWVHWAPLGQVNYSSTVLSDDFPWNLTNQATRATGLTKTDERSFAGLLSVQKRPANPYKPRTAQKYEIRVELEEQGRFAAIRFEPLPKSLGGVFAYTFSDYGVRADVVAPPVEDVVEADSSLFLEVLLPY